MWRDSQSVVLRTLHRSEVVQSVRILELHDPDLSIMQTVTTSRGCSKVKLSQWCCPPSSLCCPYPREMEQVSSHLAIRLIVAMCWHQKPRPRHGPTEPSQDRPSSMRDSSAPQESETMRHDVKSKSKPHNSSRSSSQCCYHCGRVSLCREFDTDHVEQLPQRTTINDVSTFPALVQHELFVLLRVSKCQTFPHPHRGAIPIAEALLLHRRKSNV